MTSQLPHTPEEEESGCLPFAGATGRGVRVAVVDSGVHARHPHIGAIAGGVSITPSGDLDPSGYTDLLGHGTAVMAVIQEKSPAAVCFAVRVFQRELRTRAANLIRAIDIGVSSRKWT
jgi:subtilisin family serine protease